MPDNRTFLVFAMLMLCFTAYSQQDGFSSQPQRRGDYSLVAYVSGGAGYYSSYAGELEYLNPTINNLNPVTSLRLMWHPDNLLKLGIETGYMTFLSYSLTDSAGNRGKVNLEAIPVLLEWTMAVTKRFNVFVGSGVYFLNTKLDYLGKTSSKKLSIGWMGAASYIHPLSKNLGLGAELKWMDAAESRDGSICLQLQLVWRFLKW